MTRGRAARFAALGAAALHCAGCGGTAPIPADEAVAHYDALAEDLTTGLAGTGLDLTHEPSTRTVTKEGGTCVYTPGTWTPAGGSGGDVSDDEAWGSSREALDPVLEEAGFDPLGDPQRQGAKSFVASTDEHGATLRLDDQGTLRLYGARVETEDCSASALGL